MLWFCYDENGKKFGPFSDNQARQMLLEQVDYSNRTESDLSSVIQGTESGAAGARRIIKINDLEYAFHWCPAGSFLMGSPEEEENRFYNEIQHEVTFRRGFWMMEHEVTQEMWSNVMGDNPSEFKGDLLPIECVSWNDCQDFISKLQSLAPRGVDLRLPSEAEWEYACRAGTSGPYAGSGDLNDLGWYEANSELKTHKVKMKKPNGWGLYDMFGNVWEWCEDWYGSYPNTGVTDPQGPDSGLYRVNRGGSWGGNAGLCRAAYRNSFAPDFRFDYLGFRLASSSLETAPVSGSKSAE